LSPHRERDSVSDSAGDGNGNGIDNGGVGNDITDRLPARITSVLPQKKNRDRYSIFIDGEFVIGVSESTLLEFGIEKGLELTPALLGKLRSAEGREAVKSYCLRRLGQRDHSRKELFDKARKKDYPSDIVNGVLDELEAKGYLDDRSFARKFASDKSRLNNWGPAKIKAHLFKKGITESAADEGIDRAFDSEEVKETLFELVEKKRRRFLREENLLKRKKKIFDYLRRKGYRTDSIFEVLDELAESID